MQTYAVLSAPEQSLIEATLNAVRREAQQLGIQLPDDEPSAQAAEGLARWFAGATVPRPIRAARLGGQPEVG